MPQIWWEINKVKPDTRGKMLSNWETAFTCMMAAGPGEWKEIFVKLSRGEVLSSSWERGNKISGKQVVKKQTRTWEERKMSQLLTATKPKTVVQGPALPRKEPSAAEMEAVPP